MELGLKGKVVWITGGSKGIGRACAYAFAEEGANVAVTAREPERLAAVAEDVQRKHGVQTLAVPGDMTRMEDVQRCVDRVLERFGRIDILVTSAGASPGGVLERLTEEDWALSLQLKFLGYVRACKAVLPHMVKQGRGSVVMIVGNDGIKPAYWELSASAANAADLAVMQALAEQYGKHGIRINAVNPGPVDTDRWTGLVRAYARDMGVDEETASKRAIASIPLGRIATPEEVASVAVFVASDRCAIMNGAMITLDGGQRKALMDLR